MYNNTRPKENNKINESYFDHKPEKSPLSKKLSNLRPVG